MTDRNVSDISINQLKSSLKQSKKTLKLAHVNVENLQVHRDSFVSLFSDGSFDIIALSETFLKPEVSSLPYNLNGYVLFRNDRIGKEGGGVAIYLRNMFSYKIIRQSTGVYTKTPEYLILEISLTWKLLLCVVYRPPKAGGLSDMFDVLSDLLPIYNNLVIIGDMNIDIHTDRVYYDKTLLLNTIDNLNLCILPLNPTYHLPDSDTLLDLIICNDKQRVKCFGQIPVSGLSYHDLIFVELNLKVRLNTEKNCIVVRDFKNINSDCLKRECLNIHWDDLYTSNCINDKVDVLVTSLLRLYDKYVPERKIVNNKNSCPWINADIRHLMRERDVLYKRYVRSKDRVVWEEYKVLRNRVKRQIRDERNRHFELLFKSSKSSKDLWKILKSQGCGKEQKMLAEPIVSLDSLNDYFCGINNYFDNNLIDYYTNQARLNRDVNNVISFDEVNHESIFMVLNDIASNAVGNDGLHLKFLKIIWDEIKEVVCHIFNFSIINSVYPDIWKKSTIIPLPKSKEPLECRDYRPINILCVLGKALDKLVYIQLCKFIEENNVMSMYQSGYRAKFSTQTALIKVLDDVRLAMDKRSVTLLMLLDFSRAFDCVNHNLLLAIMKSYNFTDNVIKWFKAYLTDRHQQIRTAGGSLSSWRHNSLGVPQGSTLSALLFSLYINRISDCLRHCKTMLYADDMQVYINSDPNSMNETVRLLNFDLDLIFLWCRDHGLKLNISKCKPIMIGTSRMLNNIDLGNIESVAINGQILNYEKSVKNLGLRITTNLSWNDQVDFVCKKVFQCLSQLKRLCFVPPIHVKKKLVFSLIFPYFDYAISAYCDLSNELTTKLQRAQNACIRYIYSLRLDDHVTRYYRDMNCLKIKERREMNILISTFKILKYRKPEYLYDNYRTMSNVHLRNTRFGSQVLQFPVHRTVIYTKSFHVMSIRLMNALDDSLRNSLNEKSFSVKLKNHLIKRYDIN